MKCQPCGQDNAASALFCTACRRPLVAPSKLPTRLEPLAQPAMAAAAPAMAPSSGGTADFAPSRNRFAPPNGGRTSRLGGDSELLTEQDAWAAVIGNSGTHHYLQSFERLANGESGGWNWAAFFLRGYWMLYRKMWLTALLWYFAPILSLVVLLPVAAVARSAAPLLLIAWVVGLLALPGWKGNAWYYRLCEKRIRDVRARGGSKEQILARLEASGGTSSILVVLLALVGVVFFIGILAAVSLPAYQTYTVKAKVAEAIPLGAEVAAAVGRQYEQTGQLPSQSDVDGIVRRSVHSSRYVSGVDLDGTSGTLTLKLTAAPRGDGSIQFVPSSDNNHHLSWTCTAPADMQRFVPASCRSEGAAR